MRLSKELRQRLNKIKSKRSKRNGVIPMMGEDIYHELKSQTDKRANGRRLIPAEHAREAKIIKTHP